MNHLKLATAAIYIFTSTTVFAQTRGSTVPTTGTVTNTTAPVNNSNNGVATYGDTTYGSGSTDGNIVNSTSGVAPSTPALSATPSANLQSSGSTADSSTAGGYAPIVTNDTSGIQSSGKSSSGNNNVGMILGIGATAYAGYNAVTCCSASPACAVCGWWVAGTLAAAAVTGYMMTAKNKSDGTVAAVTDPNATSGTGSGATATGANNNTSAMNYSQDPAWQNAQKSIDQLKAAGWNVDPAAGTATNTKTGQTISASDLSSPSAMSAAGYSAADIKAFQGITDQMNAAGKKLAATRGVDASGDLFDGVAGGGKSGSSAAGNMAFANAALRAANRQVGMGVNRDPAQVAGMSKSFNGEQIGVAQDSLFNMIDRRYQLHDKNGGFIAP